MIDDVKQELTALWACMTVVRQLNGNKAKGEYLLAEFTKNQVLRQWFTLALRGDYDYGVTTREVMTITVMGNSDDARKHPRQLLKAIATQAITQSAFNYQWVTWLHDLPAELHRPLRMVLDRDMGGVGLSVDLLNKVLVKLEKPTVPPMPQEPPARQRNLSDFLLIISTDGTGDVHNAVFLSPDNKKVGHLQMETNRAAKEFVNALRAAGVAVTVPSYAKGL